MSKRKTESQIIALLKKAEAGIPVADRLDQQTGSPWYVAYPCLLVNPRLGSPTPPCLKSTRKKLRFALVRTKKNCFGHKVHKRSRSTCIDAFNSPKLNKTLVLSILKRINTCVHWTLTN